MLLRQFIPSLGVGGRGGLRLGYLWPLQIFVGREWDLWVKTAELSRQEYWCPLLNAAQTRRCLR